MPTEPVTEPMPGPAGSRLWVTGLWLIAAAVAFLVANVVGLLGYAVWHGWAHPGIALSLQGLVQNGSAVAISTAIASPLLIGFFVAAARLTTPGWADYLGLSWPTARQWGIGIAAGVVLLLLEAGFEQIVPDPKAADFMFGTFQSARAEGTLAVLVAAVVVLGPVSEEIAFRGFFYARLAPRLGTVAAILLTAAAWAGLHVQYGWTSIAEIAVMGLTFGALRWYAGSTVLTMLIHAAWNAAGLLQVAWQSGHG